MNFRSCFKLKYFIIAGLTLIVLIFPLILSPFRLNLAIEMLIFSLFATSFNLLYRYSGLLPFGHGAFFGIGGYVTALLFNHLAHIPLLLTLSIAAIAGLVAGVFIGLFCIRLKGAYFAFISLAFQMFLYTLAFSWRTLTGGDDGMGVTRPDLDLPFLSKISMMDEGNIYWFILVIVILGIVACYFFLETPIANSIVCVRENEIRASFLGYDPFLTKLVNFSLASFLAALSGSLFVFFEKFIGTSSMNLDMSLTVVLMTVIGGSGHFLGPALGASLYILVQDWISNLTDRSWLIMGILFVFVVLYLRGGVISLFQSEKMGKIRLLIRGRGN